MDARFLPARSDAWKEAYQVHHRRGWHEVHQLETEVPSLCSFATGHVRRFRLRVNAGLEIARHGSRAAPPFREIGLHKTACPELPPHPGAWQERTALGRSSLLRTIGFAFPLPCKMANVLWTLQNPDVDHTAAGSNNIRTACIENTTSG